MEWGYRLKALREQKGWSQTTLAGISDLDQTTIAKLESGKREFSLGIVKKLADAFEMDIPETIVILEGMKHHNNEEVIEGIYRNYILLRSAAMEYYSLTRNLIANQKKLIKEADSIRETDWEFHRQSRSSTNSWSAVDYTPNNKEGGTRLMPKSLTLYQFLNNVFLTALPMNKI